MFLSIKEQVPRKVLASQTTTFTYRSVSISGYTEHFSWPLRNHWNNRYLHFNTIMPPDHGNRTEPPKWSLLPIQIHNNALCRCRSRWRAWWKGKRCRNDLSGEQNKKQLSIKYYLFIRQRNLFSNPKSSIATINCKHTNCQYIKFGQPEKRSKTTKYTYRKLDKTQQHVAILIHIKSQTKDLSSLNQKINRHIFRIPNS